MRRCKMAFHETYGIVFSAAWPSTCTGKKLGSSAYVEDPGNGRLGGFRAREVSAFFVVSTLFHKLDVCQLGTAKLRQRHR